MADTAVVIDCEFFAALVGRTPVLVLVVAEVLRLTGLRLVRAIRRRRRPGELAGQQQNEEEDE